jgi:hypothetical protein
MTGLAAMARCRLCEDELQRMKLIWDEGSGSRTWALKSSVSFVNFLIKLNNARGEGGARPRVFAPLIDWRQLDRS